MTVCDLADRGVSDRWKTLWGHHLSDYLLVSLEEIGVVITEARPPLSSDRGRLPRHFSAKAGQMIIASNWHPQKHLNYLSATVTQRAKFFLPFGKLSILLFSFNPVVLTHTNQSLVSASATIFP